jgi:hypothetical protein
MGSKITPQVHICRNNGEPNEVIYFKTYKEVLKNIKGIIENTAYVPVVYRSRRGEWGEWFEYWELDGNGKPRIFKDGWS